MKDETAHSLRTRNIGAPSTLGRFVHAVGKEQRRWQYTWTGSHLIREPLRTSSLKEGTMGTVGE
jgi:hypothetical protein